MRRFVLAFALASLSVAACGGIALESSDGACRGEQLPACPVTACADGRRQDGGVACVDGRYVCETVSCADDAGPDGSSCENGYWFEACEGGFITSECCAGGELCAPPATYCDLGGGRCSMGACEAGTCNGYEVTYCSAEGYISQYCCPANADCVTSGNYCDLGNGRCSNAACPIQDAGAPDTCTSAIDANDYDKSCKTDADCVSVYSGSLCNACECPNDAVGAGGIVQYKNDLASRNNHPLACDCPAYPPASCVGGRCGLYFPD